MNITETERLALQEKIRAALPGCGTPYETPFVHPHPEFFIGHKEQSFKGTAFAHSGHDEPELIGKGVFTISGGKGMLAVGYIEHRANKADKVVEMTVSSTPGPDEPQLILHRFKLN